MCKFIFSTFITISWYIKHTILILHKNANETRNIELKWFHMKHKNRTLILKFILDISYLCPFVNLRNGVRNSMFPQNIHSFKHNSMSIYASLHYSNVERWIINVYVVTQKVFVHRRDAWRLQTSKDTPQTKTKNFMLILLWSFKI